MNSPVGWLEQSNGDDEAFAPITFAGGGHNERPTKNRSWNDRVRLDFWSRTNKAHLLALLVIRNIDCA